MNAIIVSAGNATRLGSLTKKIPKGLLDINGKSILEKQIEIFEKNGIKRIFVITGPFKDFGLKNVNYIHDENYEKHEVLGSLMAAREEISEEVIISYSDIIFDEKILQEMMKAESDICIAIDMNWEKSYENRTLHPKSEADNVLLAKNNHIKKFKKNIIKKNDDEEIGEFIGLTKMTKKGANIFRDEYIKLENSHGGEFHNAPSFKKSYLTDFFQELIEKKITIRPIQISGKWCEIDTPEDLTNARKIFN